MLKTSTTSSKTSGVGGIYHQVAGADADHGKHGGAYLQLVDVVWADVRRGASPRGGDESASAIGGSGKDDQVRRTSDLKGEFATRKKRRDTEADLKYQQDLTKI